ncbi:hypothetical protein Tco_0759827 [Tanacetum coccineum]
MEEMMKEWMASQMEVNERMKNQVVELENQINQGSRNHQAIIQNLERQFEHLVKIQPSKSLPRTTNTKPRHEFFYKPPSIRNDDNKGDVKFIETFADVVLLNHVGEKEIKSIVGDGIGVLTKKKIKKNDMGLLKELAMEWNMERKIDE